MECEEGEEKMTKQKRNYSQHDKKYPRIRTELQTYQRLAHVAEECDMELNALTSMCLNYALDHLVMKEIPVVRKEVEFID